MDVFILQHVHAFDDREADVKFIGVYALHATATAAIERLRQQPGFCESPEGFTIDRYTLDVDHWIEGYATIGPNELL